MAKGSIDSGDTSLRESAATSHSHGQLYWLFANYIASPAADFVRRHKRKFWIALALLVVLAVIFRPMWHSYAIALRTHLLLFFLFAFATGGAVWWLLTRHSMKWRFIAASSMFVVVMGFYYIGTTTYNLINLWARYESLNRVPLKQMALTGHERIQPYLSIVTDVHQKISGGQEASIPSLVRIGSDYFWSIMIGPGYWWGQLFGAVKTVKIISATDANPLWRDEKVEFGIAESMVLSHDIHTCAVRSLGPLRFWSYEPEEVKAMYNDAGKMVQVVTLTRWSGLGYRPEFGGVIVVKEGDSPMFSWEWFKLVMTGCGEWIRPAEIKNHKFLQGQNLVPYTVGRYKAESFRFRGGFFDAWKGFHVDDVRIPTVIDDSNVQPIVQYLSDIPGEDGKLYQSFSLEPYNPDKQAFSLAVMIPGDGSSDRVYTYEPVNLTGPTAIAGKVKSNNPVIDWNNSFPAEARWFVRDINGERLFFIYTSVVTRDAKAGRANAGTIAEVPVTDPRGSTNTYWMKDANPTRWTERLEKELVRTK